MKRVRHPALLDFVEGGKAGIHGAAPGDLKAEAGPSAK
jgi:hypothetical protein